MFLKELSKSEYKRVFDSSWNFKGEDTKLSNHGFHTYPAMMIPQIARRLIREYGSDAEALLDPFMGSGTSLLESKLHKNFLRAYGIDINPLARLISKVKITPINSSILEKEVNFLLTNIKKEKVEVEFKQKKVDSPELFNIDFWFKPQVIQDLTIIKKNIDLIKNDDVRDFMKVVFSEIVRNASNTRNGEFKLYRMNDEKLKKYSPNTIGFFERKVKENMESMSSFNKEATKTEIIILDEDSRNRTSIPSNSVDFVLTSPPYGDSRTTVAYGQFSRLALQWLDFDYDLVKDIDKTSLGGRPVKDFNYDLDSFTLSKILEDIRAQDENRARDVLTFYLDFFECVKEMDRIVKEGSKLCFVVGNRTVKGINIPTDMIIFELFESLGKYKHIKTIVRSIPSKRMPKKNSPTNVKGELVTTMNEEYIVVIEKV